MFETKRLRLTPIKTSNHLELFALFSDPEVMKSSLNGTKSVKEVKCWVAQKVEENRSNKGVNIFVVKLKSTGSIIGYCGLTVNRDIDGSEEVEIGYRLIRKYWGHGYATEAASAVRDYAFGELKLTRLVALIEPINHRSISVAKKIGMSYEKDVMLEGYDHPDHLYSMSSKAIV